MGVGPMIAYLNWRGPQGRETVDQLDSADFPNRKAFRAELARLIGGYALCGMGGVYGSSRPCEGWDATTYRVTVETYSLESGQVGEPVGVIYESTHRTPSAAARRLANLISGRTGEGKRLTHKAGLGLRMVIIDPERGPMPLAPFRALRCGQ